MLSRAVGRNLLKQAGAFRAVMPSVYTHNHIKTNITLDRSFASVVKLQYEEDDSDPNLFDEDPDYQPSGGNQPKGEFPTFTLADCKERENYVAIGGMVYDLTDLKSYHPGGKQVINLAHGKDVSKVFQKEVGHSELAQEQMKQYVKGFLAEGEETPAEDLLGLSTAATSEVDKMKCFQCGQTKKQDHCNITGVCGKQPETAALQDYILWQIKGCGQLAHRIRKAGLDIPDRYNFDHYLAVKTFATLTNVDFSDDRFHTAAIKLNEQRDMLQKIVRDNNIEEDDDLKNGAANFHFKDDRAELLKLAKSVGIAQREKLAKEDIDGFYLQEFCQQSLKGTMAYFDHAMTTNKFFNKAFGKGNIDEWITKEEWTDTFDEVQRCLDRMCIKKPEFGETFKDVLAQGQLAGRSMEQLDRSHNHVFGSPVPTEVPMTPVPGKAILVSGHDMTATKRLLEQTEGTGINIYTHGELLPAFGQPELRKHKHLVGNWGRAWFKQQTDFSLFPGPILVTSNCLLKSRENQKDRIYSNLASWPDIPYIADDLNFSTIIEHAQRCPPITQEHIDTIPTAILGKPWYTGHGRQWLVDNAGLVVDAIKKGHLKNIFVYGGCDGWEPQRWYMRRSAKTIPSDSLVITLACTKQRFKNLDFGTIPNTDLPRIVDMGQCNDAWGAIEVAYALADALGESVHNIPLHMQISWLEQKAACILAYLLYAGFKNIKWGPTRPGWMTDKIQTTLEDAQNLKFWNTDNIAADMKEMLSN